MILWQIKDCRRNTPRWVLKRGGRHTKKAKPRLQDPGVQQLLKGDLSLWQDDAEITGALLDVHTPQGVE